MQKKYLIIIAALLLLLVWGSGCSCPLVKGHHSTAVSCNKSEDGRTLVKGKIYAPLEKSYVYIYREGDDVHGPEFASSEATDSEGNFSLSLPPGKYYMVARRRLQGERGPLHAGDFKSEIVPFTVKAGNVVEADLTCRIKGDNEEYYKIPGTEKSDTAISGEILDSEGKPVAGMRVHVYQYIQMSERPKFISAPTGPDGKYIIYLPKGGTYYVCARDSFGGPPKLGDLYGRYDGGAINPSSVVLNNGEKLANINITVQRVW